MAGLETVTVFVHVMPGAFPGAIEGDVRVYRGDIPADAAEVFNHTGWVRFDEVPIQQAPEAFRYLDKSDGGEDLVW